LLLVIVPFAVTKHFILMQSHFSFLIFGAIEVQVKKASPVPVSLKDSPCFPLGVSKFHLFFFNFFMILLAYSSCTGGYIVIFTYVFTIYHSRIYPLHHSPPSHLIPFLEQFQQVSFLYFHIWIQNTTTIYTLIPPFLMYTPLPQVPTPVKDLFFPPALHFWAIGVWRDKENARK
jgi:hypothetical protein